MEQNDPPPVAALFLVVFDQKVGYTISWKRAAPDVDIDGVEYKSLPSGLHGVQEDLVYFIHGSYAGVSAFVRGEADQQHRNASFVAVGALVSRRHERLGQAWLHAQELRRMGRELANNVSDMGVLELFWEQHRRDHATEKDATSSTFERTGPLISNVNSPPGIAGHTSDRNAVSPVASDHPALSIPELLDVFGPLIFPLYRAVLLRKRILLLGHPSVQRNCSYVYDLSVLASLPHSLDEVLLPGTEQLVDTRSLFSVGIQDMAFLSDQAGGTGWLACTTDDIMGEKHQLYDVLVRLPPTQPGPASYRSRPTIRTSDGSIIKATQRDLRRYRSLRVELKRMQPARAWFQDNENEEPERTDEDDRTSLASSRSVPGAFRNEPESAAVAQYGNEIVEPLAWSAVAYNGFMWWASAGEKEAWDNEEADTDRDMMADLPDACEELLWTGAPNVETGDAPSEIRATAVKLIGYFHRTTAHILRHLAEVVQAADDETEEGLLEGPIPVTTADMHCMGLDTSSERDREFVREATRLYFERETTIEDVGIRMCGVRVC